MEESPQSPTYEEVPKPPIAPTTLGQPEIVSDPAVRFRGLGTNFKAKLIGIDEVPDSRGDNMCQESILKLKAARKVSGEHKQKITVNVSLEGIKIVDVLSGEVHHVHPVHRISFISRDLTDRRAFGYVYGAGEGRHQFFGIKTAKVAEVLVLALRDLFQVVYNMKKKEMEDAKTHEVNGNKAEVKETEDVYTLPNKKRTVPAETQPQTTGSMLDLETQLTNIQEGINNIDSFNSPWSNELPTSPDTPFSPPANGSSNDLFGIANLSDISSLSSDFSCASGFALEHSMNGSEKGLSQQEQFVRSGSSRSAASWHGFRLGQNNAPTRSSSHSGRSRRLGSLVDRETPQIKSSSTSAMTKSNAEILNRDSVERTLNGTAENEGRLSKDSVVTLGGNNEGDGHKHKDSGDESVRPHVIEKTRDTLQTSTSMSSLPGSEKKLKKSSSSGFFSKSEKNKKEKSKKPQKREKLKSRKEKSKNRGSRSADEKPPAGKLPESLNSSKNSISDLSNSSKTSLKNTPASVADTKRRDSVSSINSVQSCVVPSTVYSTDTKALSTSRISLDNIKKTSLTSTPTHTESLPPSSAIEKSLQSYIVQSSICPRTRPKVKHSGRVTEAEGNPKNPPMFKTHPNTQHKSTSQISSIDTNSDTKLDQGGADSSSAQPTWTASFDTDFAQVKPSEKVDNFENRVDPFTGVKSDSLNIDPAGSAGFDDAAWGSAPTEEQTTEVGADVFTESSFDPFLNTNEVNFQSNPFEVDPFQNVQMEDPLTDPFAPFDENEFFGEPSESQTKLDSPSDQERTLTYSSEFLSQSDNENSADDAQYAVEPSNKVTFPDGMDNLPTHLGNSQHETSADSSSLTSGMSTPVNSSSPVPTSHSSPVKDVPSIPPPLPPRIPPRLKTSRPSPTMDETDDSPQVPPPPLPDICPSLSFEMEDEDLMDEIDSFNLDPPNYMPPALPRVITRPASSPPVKTPKMPPAIPERTHSRHSSLGSGMTKVSASKLVLAEDSFLQANPPPAPQKNSSYSDELFALDAQAAQPAPTPGAKLTKDQILMGYGGAPQQGMFPGQQQMMPPGGQMPGQYGVHPQMAQGFPQQAAAFGQPAASAPFGMFPSGPSPAIPPRPGAMRPPVQQLAPGGAPQNPFGDAASAGVNSAGLLAPSNSMPPAADPTAPASKAASDPFASLIPGMGGSTSKKDMFKNFEMAKPPQPPPRTNATPINTTADVASNEKAPTSDFDDYFIKNVGGIPITDTQPPVAAPRNVAAGTSDPFGMGLDQGPPAANQAMDDPFASNGAFTEPFQFNQTTDNSQSLFGL